MTSQTVLRLLVIKVRSVALNFRNTAISTGKYPFPVKNNVVPGSNAIGHIISIRKGNNRLGGLIDSVLREYVAVLPAAVVNLPDSYLSYSQWASVVSNTVLYLGTERISITGIVLIEEVQKITHGSGVDYIVENGGGTIKQSLEAVAYDGNIAVIGFLSPSFQHSMPDVAGLALAKGVIVRGIMIGSKQLLEDAVRFICARNMPVPVEKTFKFSRD
ncbi:hypothetical protein BDV34DRAFT_210277 [Aspergillus parasiticus]|uniref:Alcohol dehydrogenase-like C-terminal domain-containing protein n=1 Tax=Aspergillus parasiticus TaxID=5067 RepID=A0A5N6DWB0_ASPPA|nr:hypothetical protein BDV34DRAFT_210277 [Aspergillus parasiticus]